MAAEIPTVRDMSDEWREVPDPDSTPLEEFSAKFRTALDATLEETPKSWIFDGKRTYFRTIERGKGPNNKWQITVTLQGDDEIIIYACIGHMPLLSPYHSMRFKSGKLIERRGLPMPLHHSNDGQELLAELDEILESEKQELPQNLQRLISA